VSTHKLKEKATMGEATIIGVELAKSVFQLHGAVADGSVVFRKKLSRPQFGRFMTDRAPCLVAMEACAGGNHWAREMARHWHEVRLIAPRYVKPFIERQKNDAADAEAIVEAAQRPTMRFVEMGWMRRTGRPCSCDANGAGFFINKINRLKV
jgi:transposase